MSDVITSIEAGRSRSWVDPVGSLELASLCCNQLKRKFASIQDRGGKVYFVTLTYDPDQWLSDGVTWRNAQANQRLAASEKCWDAMTRDKHLHHFVDRLESLTGLKLSGRWWSKREFTKNGFLHHHLVIDGPDFMDFSCVNQAWHFGRVDAQVARTSDGLASYVGKYCTKVGETPPAWLFERPAGSLRFTTSSDRWWSSDLGKVGPVRPRSIVRKPRRTDRQEDKAYDCFETVGMRINRKAQTVIVRSNGQRDEVQGLTFDDYRRYRDPRTAAAVIKARRSMDAVVGLPFSQAVRELRQISADLRRNSPPSGSVPGAACGSSAADRPDGFVSYPVPGPLPAPLYRSAADPGHRPSFQGSPPGRDPAAGGIAAATAEQLSLYPAFGVASCRGHGERSEHCGGDAAGLARALLILSSPQESSTGKKEKRKITQNGIPPG